LDNLYRNLFVGYLLKKYAEQPFTVLFITHDYSILSEIYNKYKNLLDRMHFREFHREHDNKVNIKDFSANDYLGWMNSLKQDSSSGPQGQTVLRVNSSFNIFGRSLGIYGDPDHKRPQDLVIHKGEAVYVKAPSGEGKTTLANIIMGLFKAEKFSMSLAEFKITHRSKKEIWSSKIWGKKASMVFQHADEALNPESTVMEAFTGLPLGNRLTYETLGPKLGELFDEEIDQAFMHKKVAFLSGGQKQRLNLLRTLILNTDLIILDEPLNGLDFESIKKVLSILDEKRNSGSAILIISHNEEIFERVIESGNVYYLKSN
ncbi:MAG: ATP-binding cassette domain-containing protein, partial [bacterium]